MHKYILVMMVVILTACGSQDATPSRTYELGAEIYSNSFDDPASWESFGALDTQFGIRDGVYTALSNGGGYIPVTNGETHTDAVLEATVELLAGSNNVIYGISCRAQAANSSVAYYFLLDGAGRYGIRIGDGGQVRVAVPWTEHPAIKSGIDTNRLRAVCIGNYFAFYINDRFVAETTHDWLVAGQMGLVVSSPSGTAVSANFDDVRIWEATLVQ